MAESRRQRVRGATVADIKRIATRQMAADGTAGLSLRAIAQEMGVTPPALYRYFPSRDDLITALIVDAYNDLADMLEDGVAERRGRSIGEIVFDGLLTYREWALAHPTEYQLIFGNPIPGYTAPAEVTVPPARRSISTLARLVGEAAARGELRPAHMPPLDPELRAYLEGWNELEGYEASAEALELVLATWAHAHGLVTLELFGQLQPIIGGTAPILYRAEIEASVRRLGLTLPDNVRGRGEDEAVTAK